MTGSSVDPGNQAAGQYCNQTHTTTCAFNFSTDLVHWYNAWVGYATDDTNQQFVEFGGGHANSPNNELATFSLRGSSPHWLPFGQGSVNSVMPTICGSADSFLYEAMSPTILLQDNTTHTGYSTATWPTARETYSGMFYYPTHNSILMLGGSLNCVGFLSQEVWEFNLSNSTFSIVTPYGPLPSFGEVHGTYNTDNDTIVINTPNGAGPIAVYAPTTNTIAIKVASPNWTINGDVNGMNHAQLVYDPLDKLVIGFATVPGVANCTLSGDKAYSDYFESLPRVCPEPFRGVRAWDWTAGSPSTLVWDDASCDLIYAYGGVVWDSALGLVVGYPGGGDQIFFFNPQGTSVVTNYGTVPSHKCLDVTMGTSKGTDYPDDPFFYSSDNNAFLGLDNRLAYFASLDVIVLQNNVTNNVWMLRFHP